MSIKGYQKSFWERIFTLCQSVCQRSYVDAHPGRDTHKPAFDPLSTEVRGVGNTYFALLCVIVLASLPLIPSVPLNPNRNVTQLHCSINS